MTDTPLFLTNSKWYHYEERQNKDGVYFQRFELTNKAPKAAIDSFKTMMIMIGPDCKIDPNNLNRFQQALGFAARQHFFSEQHGLSNNDLSKELVFISYAIRSYQLLDDNLSAPNTLIFKKRIATLYRKFLKEHKTRINDEALNQWIVEQDNKIS